MNPVIQSVRPRVLPRILTNCCNFVALGLSFLLGNKIEWHRICFGDCGGGGGGGSLCVCVFYSLIQIAISD